MVQSCALCAADSEADGLITVVHGAISEGSSLGSALASTITDVADCVGGPLSRCSVGDILLSNDRIRVVVQKVERNYLGGIGQFGGQIIDADLVRVGPDPDRDNFEEFAVALNIESTAHYTDVTIVNDGSNGGSAVVRAVGVDDLLDLLNPSSVLAGFGFTLPASTNDNDIPVSVVTNYILDPGDDYVRVETTVLNEGVSDLSIFMGEYFNGSGQVELFQGGYGFGEPLVTSSCISSQCDNTSILVYSGEDDADGVSYGYAVEVPRSSTFSTSGVTVPQFGVNILNALLGLTPPNQHFEPLNDPGDSQTYTRFFIVGDGSVSSVTDARFAAQCIPVGSLSGTAMVNGSPAAGIDIAVVGEQELGPGSGDAIHPFVETNIVTHTRSDASGAYSVNVPPGDYTIIANLEGSPYEGGGSTPTGHSVPVTAFQNTVQDVDIPLTGGLRVRVVDGTGTGIWPDGAVAGRVSVVGFDPSPDPLNTQAIFGGVVSNSTGVFGEKSEDGFPFGTTLVTYADDSGDSGVLPLEPGDYRVVVSHGTEYSIDFADVTIAAGATTTVDATVEHVIDTTGFASGDFHVHSIDSPDSEVSRAERVVSMLGEGVDFFATTDHGYRADFSSTIAALGVGSLISTCVGQEITTFDYGHFNAWPLDFIAGLPNHGFVDHGGAAPDGMDYPSFGNYSETPATIISDAHAAYTTGSGVNTVQINHYYSHFGIDGGSGLAIDTGTEPPSSAVSAIMGPARRLDPLVGNYFSGTFDALEIWIGESRGQVFGNFLGQNAGDWFNMINQDIISTAIADSDTHRRFLTQAGFPRSMVANLDDDTVGSLDQDDMSAQVNAGRVLGTNGPMIRITAHAVTPDVSAGLDLGRCTGVVSCTNTDTCPPCRTTGDCGLGETCTALPLQIGTGAGTVNITVDVQSPEWAPFDTVELFINSTTTRVTTPNVQTGAGLVNVNRYTIAAEQAKTAPADFTISTVPVAGTSSSRLEARVTFSISPSVDTWVVAMVSGTDGVSEPLFPVVPNSIDPLSNTTLANLVDGNLGEDGMPAYAFSNPIFLEVDGDAWVGPGVQINP
jgi:hypothetical protein